MGINKLTVDSVFLQGFQNLDKYNIVLTAATPGVQSPYAPGELGQNIAWLNRMYTIVKVDPGASAVVAGQLLFWKDKTKYIVTNVVANMINGGVTNAWRKEVAGIARLAFTPDATYGNQIAILVAGTGITTLASAATAGLDLVADVVGNVGQALGIAIGTAAAYPVIGTCTTAVSGATCVADIQIGLPDL